MLDALFAAVVSAFKVLVIVIVLGGFTLMLISLFTAGRCAG